MFDYQGNEQLPVSPVKPSGLGINLVPAGLSARVLSTRTALSASKLDRLRRGKKCFVFF